MEPIMKRKVGSILEALEAAACSTFNMQDLENEIAVILAPTGELPIRKENISTKEDEPVIVGEDFSFVRHKQEYIPGLSIPQEGDNFVERETRGFGGGTFGSPRYHGGRGRRGYDRGRSSDRGNRFDYRMRHHRMSSEEEAGLPHRKETLTSTDDESGKAGDFSSYRNKPDYNPDRATPFLEREDRGKVSTERGGSGFAGPSTSRPYGNFGGPSGSRPYGNFGGPSGSRPYGGGHSGGSNFRPGFGGPNSSNFRPSFIGPGGSHPQGGFAGPSGGSNFRPGSYHGGRGYDRGRGNDRAGRSGGNRRMRRRKMTPEEEAAALARMNARDAEAERLILMAGGLLPPDPKE